ncbi:MAG: hypothetical protein HQL62_06505 [Magnetococcales bacterium]|nr:hypothetical protein [Magnetococcales bacterium]
MSRAKKKQSGARTGDSARSVRPEDGAALLREGHWRRAIDFFKPLAKEDAHAREQLIIAYQGRARELADKGMYVEAAAMLESTVQLGAPRPDPVVYLPWLMQANWVGKGVELLMAGDDSWKNQHPDLWEKGQEWLAALLLTGQANVLPALPADSPLPAQKNLVLQALESWQKGDEITAGQVIRQLPLRSPFRRWRVFLQALLEPDHTRANRLLDTIPGDSLISPWVGIARAVREENMALVSALRSLPESGLRLAARILGIAEPRMRLFRDLVARAHEPGRLFSTILGAKNPPWPQQEAERACRAILPHHATSLAPYQNHFPPLPDWEASRLQAIQAERKHAWVSAIASWKRCIQELHQRAEEKDNRLLIAAIHRHLAPLLNRVGKESTSSLKTSLEFDPEHRETWLEVLTGETSNDQPSERRIWVEKALLRFPQDVTFLEAAMDLALATKAFKKAANLARKILDQDPIHRGVREKMIHAHLAHARKQVQAGRLDLAAKEMDQAQAMDRAETPHAMLIICRGLLEVARHNDDTARNLLATAAASLDFPLGTACLVAIEARRMRLPGGRLKTWQKDLETLLRATRDSASVVRMAEIVRRSSPTIDAAIRETLAPVQKELRRLAKTTWSRQTLEGLCEFWHENNLHTILHAHAKQGLLQWPDQPLWVYYDIHAQTEGNKQRIRSADWQALKQAARQARGAHDYRLAKRIELLLGWDDHDIFGYDRSPLDDDEDDFFGDKGPFGSLDSSQTPFGSMEDVPFMVFRTILEDALPGWRRKDRRVVRNLLLETLGSIPIPAEDLDHLIDLFLAEEMPETPGEPPRQETPKPRQGGSKKTPRHFPQAPQDHG